MIGSAWVLLVHVRLHLLGIFYKDIGVPSAF